MKKNKELNQQIRNVAVDKNGRPTIDVDERKSIYKSISEALKAIPITNRNVGLTISIYNGSKVIEYWWEKGIKDSDLIKKINTDDIPRIDAKLVDLQNQIDGINNIEFKVFDSLPEVGESSIIYVIPNSVSEEDDDFIEYFWIKSQQRYERFGGLNVDGGVTINNFYTFDSNVFTVTDEYGIKKVSLNSNLLHIFSNGINLYKNPYGSSENNELVSIFSNSGSTSSYNYSNGIITILRTIEDLNNRSITNYDITISGGITITKYMDGGSIGESEFGSNYLKLSQIEQDYSSYIELTNDSIIVDNDGTSIFDLSKNKLNVEVNKFKVNTQQTDGFRLLVDDKYGIEAYKISENIGNGVNIFTDNSRITLRNNIISLESGKISVTNLYLTDTQGSIQKGFEALYDTSHAQLTAGIRATCSVWVQNTDLFGLRSTDNYSRTLLKLNDIIYRKSTTSSTYGSSIISWYENTNKYPELKLGWNQELQFKENEIDLIAFNANCYITSNLITLSHGDANCYIYNNGECGFDTSMDSSIKILSNGDIKLRQIYNHIDIIDSDNIRKILIESGYDNYKGFVQLKASDSYITINGGVDGNYDIRMYAADGILIDGTNNSRIGIDSDGWCFIKGSVQSKMYIDEYNNVYINVEKDEDLNIAKINLQQGTNSYITLYKNNNFEDNIDIRTKYFTFKDSSNNTLFTIDGDFNWNLSNQFRWSLGNNKYVQIVTTGIEYFDGTNTYIKTWAQVFS